MRKRSRYKPRPVIKNMMGWILEGQAPISQHEDGAYLLRIQVALHEAAANIAQGKGGFLDLDNLLMAQNMVHAFIEQGIGKEYEAVAAASRNALIALCVRWKEAGKAIFKGPEMQAINEMIELYEAQLGIATLREMELAILKVERSVRNKTAKVIA